MLKNKRMKKKLAQVDLAKKLIISKSYLCKLEKYPSLCNPTIKLILKLSQELEIEHTKIYLYFIENIEEKNISSK